MSLKVLQHANNLETLQVMRNGKLLPDFSYLAAKQVQSAAHLLYALVGLSTLLGVIAVLANNEILDRLGVGISSSILGAIVATLGLFTSRRSRVALILAIVLYMADIVYSFVSVAEAGGPSPGAGIAIRIIISYNLWKAVRAAGERVGRARSSPPGSAARAPPCWEWSEVSPAGECIGGWA